MEYGFFIIITLIVIYLAWKALQLARRNQGINIYDTVAPYAKNLKLEIIGNALIYSTAIELAYTLFTDGPDEAVAPLITGVAAAILIGASDPKQFTPAGAGTVAILLVVLAGLFLIQKLFVERASEQKEPSTINTSSNPTVVPEAHAGETTDRIDNS